MTGFTVPPSGFDLSRYQRDVLRAMASPGALGPSPAEALAPTATTPTAAPGSEQGFAGALADALGNVSALQNDVNDKTRRLVMGEGVEVHEVMIAAQKSDIALGMALEVRNKLVDAWEKLSRSVN